MSGDLHLHVGELQLRRLRAGELAGAELGEVQAHTESCNHCRTRLRALDEEQARFEAEIPFERFSAGVTRALRQPREQALPRGRWLYPAMAMAAMVALVVFAGPLQEAVLGPTGASGGGTNRVKGGAAIDLRISSGDDGPQRTASSDAPEPLGPGDRVRIGYKSGGHRYLTAVSVDAEGVITPLYPEQGQSLPIADKGDVQYLPGAFEFTGQGAERVIVVLTDEPLQVDALQTVVRRAYEEAGGDVTRIPPHLDLPGEQFHRTLLKP